MSSDKALNPATLELTQRIQVLFPRDIDTDVLRAWNGAPGEVISTRLRKAFGKSPETVILPEPEPLLDFVATATISATTGPFIAKDHFVKDTSRKAHVKIFYLGGNFKAWFLGKEEPFGGSTIRYAKLSRSSADGPIISELGGEEMAETTLAEIYSFMVQQPNGEGGTLLTNGYANIFYVRDVNGVLRAVDAYWGDGGWYVNACPVTDPRGWRDEDQIFSRDSR